MIAHLPAVDVLDGNFAEEKVDELIRFEGSDKFRQIEPLAVVLHGAQPAVAVGGHVQPVDGRVLTREIRWRSDEVITWRINEFRVMELKFWTKSRHQLRLKSSR